MQSADFSAYPKQTNKKKKKANARLETLRNTLKSIRSMDHEDITKNGKEKKDNRCIAEIAR